MLVYLHESELLVDGEEGSLYKLLGVGCGRITEEDLTFYLGEGD